MNQKRTNDWHQMLISDTMNGNVIRQKCETRRWNIVIYRKQVIPFCHDILSPRVKTTNDTSTVCFIAIPSSSCYCPLPGGSYQSFFTPSGAGENYAFWSIFPIYRNFLVKLHSVISHRIFWHTYIVLSNLK